MNRRGTTGNKWQEKPLPEDFLRLRSCVKSLITGELISEPFPHHWSVIFLSQYVQKCSMLRLISLTKVDYTWTIFWVVGGAKTGSAWMPKSCSLRLKKNHLTVFTSGKSSHVSRSKDMAWSSYVLVNVSQVGLNVASSNPFEMYME